MSSGLALAAKLFSVTSPLIIIQAQEVFSASKYDAEAQRAFSNHRVSHVTKISLITGSAQSLGLVVCTREEDETRERRASFDLALAECNLRRALELAALEPEDLRPEKLAQIRSRGEEKVREHGRLAAALRDSAPDLAATQHAKAQKIIDDTLENHDLHAYLESVLAEVSTIPAPVVPTEAELAVHRELIRRIIEE